MSELTQCCFCAWNNMKKRHPTWKLKKSEELPGWTAAVDKDGKEHAWFGEVTKHCVC